LPSYRHHLTEADVGDVKGSRWYRGDRVDLRFAAKQFLDGGRCLVAIAGIDEVSPMATARAVAHNLNHPAARVLRRFIDHASDMTRVASDRQIAGLC